MIEFVAPPGFAKIEEKLSMRLNLHMIALSAMLSNTAYVCQAHMKQRFMFTSNGPVTVVQGTDNCDIRVANKTGYITYQFKYRHNTISHCGYTASNGVAEDIDVKDLQASYETVSDYCATLMATRMEHVVDVTTEAANAPDETGAEVENVAIETN